MKKFIANLIKYPILIIFIINVILFLPRAAFLDSDTSMRAILTKIGVDKVEGGVEVSALTFVPTPNLNYQENYKLINATGATVADAIYKIGYYAGKKAALNLVDTIVVGEEIARDDLLTCLDGLARTKNLSNNTSLICTNDTAKNFLLASLNLNAASDLNIEELVSYSKQNIYINESNLEDFYKGYFYPTKVSSMGYIDLESGDTGLKTKENDSSGNAESSSGDSGSPTASSSENSGEKPKNTIKNEGKVAVFKDGSLKVVLSPTELKGLNWISRNYKRTSVSIKDVNDETFDGANLTFRVSKKRVVNNVYFSGNVPVFESNIYLSLLLDEAHQSDVNEKMMQSQTVNLSSEIYNKLNEQIKKEFSEGLSVLRENKVDVINSYNTFQNRTGDRFEKFLKSLDDPEDFLNYIIFKIKVDPTIVL